MLAPLAVLLPLAAPVGALPTDAPASTASLRGAHLTGWAAGAPKTRAAFLAELRAAGFNAVAVALKDYDGLVFVRGVPLAQRTTAYVNAVPDLAAVVRDVEAAGAYSIARVAVFKDDHLARARERLKPLGVKLSICTFGLTTSVDSGMGIGQRLGELAELVDYVSPMMYPSHYAKGEYGLKDPDRRPYETVRRGVQDALSRLGASPGKLRPYLQDFSLGSRYRTPQVRAQIRASEELGVGGWLLWNPQNRYTWAAAQAGLIEETKP